LNGIAFKPVEWRSTGVPIIRIQNLNGADDFNYTDKDGLPHKLLIQPGDLLFAWSGNRGTSFGSFLWGKEFPGYLNQHIFKVADFSLDQSYFYYALRAVTAYVEEQAHGIIGLVHITKPELGRISIPVPPEREQQQIGQYLDEALAGMNQLSERAKRQLQKMACRQDFLGDLRRRRSVGIAFVRLAESQLAVIDVGGAETSNVGSMHASLVVEAIMRLRSHSIGNEPQRRHRTRYHREPALAARLAEKRIDADVACRLEVLY
jgi:hypothetical protein